MSQTQKLKLRWGEKERKLLKKEQIRKGEKQTENINQPKKRQKIKEYGKPRNSGPNIFLSTLDIENLRELFAQVGMNEKGNSPAGRGWPSASLFGVTEKRKRDRMLFWYKINHG